MVKRLFIAIKIHENNSLTGLVNKLKISLKDDRIKWVDTGNIHLTLAFLGNTDAKYLDSLEKILNSASEDIPSFNIDLHGLGVFGKKSDPRVIYAAIRRNDLLGELNQNLVKGLERVKLYSEKRSFSPHITLGRVKSVRNAGYLYSLLDKYANQAILSQRVDHISLYESILKPAGPVYIELLKADLGG